MPAIQGMSAIWDVRYWEVSLYILLISFILSNKCRSSLLSKTTFRSSRSQIFFKIGVLKNFSYSQENTCVGTILLKWDPTQVFSYEYWKNFKSSFFIEHLQSLILDIYLIFYYLFFLTFSSSLFFFLLCSLISNSYRMTCAFILIFLDHDYSKTKKCNTNKQSTCF